MAQSSQVSPVEETTSPAPRIRAYWHTAAEAARILRISEPALRRRIAGGSLTAVRAGRGWRILLPGDAEPTPPEPAVERAPQPPPESKHTEAALDSLEPLVGLMRDLQRQSLALAGQIGYLQNELSRTQGQLETLREEAQKQVTSVAAVPEVDPGEHEAALAEIQRLRDELAARATSPPPAPPRRGWAFWRKSTS